MKHGRTGATAAFGAAALGLSCLTAGVGGSTATAADHLLIDNPPLSWGACQSVALIQAGAECSSLAVPLDWDKPAGEKISIAVSRVKATHDRRGVLLVDPGGPGASGLDLPAYLPG